MMRNMTFAVRKKAVERMLFDGFFVLISMLFQIRWIRYLPRFFEKKHDF